MEKPKSIIFILLKKNPTGKRHIGRPGMRWGDREELRGGTDWKARGEKDEKPDQDKFFYYLILINKLHLVYF